MVSQRVWLFAALALTIAGAPAEARCPTPVEPPLPVGQLQALAPAYQTGVASWYGKDFQGQETTSGEHYNMYGLTAAHRHLPFGTRIRVTNLENLHSVILRVNDRGPVPTDRVLDVSYAAARLLGFKAEGLAHVRIEVLNRPPAAH